MPTERSTAGTYVLLRGTAMVVLTSGQYLSISQWLEFSFEQEQKGPRVCGDRPISVGSKCDFLVISDSLPIVKAITIGFSTCQDIEHHSGSRIQSSSSSLNAALAQHADTVVLPGIKLTCGSSGDKTEVCIIRKISTRVRNVCSMCYCVISCPTGWIDKLEVLRSTRIIWWWYLGILHPWTIGGKAVFPHRVRQKGPRIIIIIRHHPQNNALACTDTTTIYRQQVSNWHHRLAGDIV